MKRKILGIIGIAVLGTICFGLSAGIAAEKVYINGFVAA